MDLSDYLTLNNITMNRFADDLEIPRTTMKTYYDKTSEPGVANARKIVQATHGAVSLDDLTKEKE